MAFTVRNLSVHAYSNGQTLWHYTASHDHLDEIMAPDYFASAAEMLTPRDTIIVSCFEGMTMVWVEFSQLSGVTVRRMI